MSKPEDIPADIKELAEQAYLHAIYMTTTDNPSEIVECIARAIQAERERCAKIAEDTVVELKHTGAWGDLHLGAGMVAAAIRRGTP